MTNKCKPFLVVAPPRGGFTLLLSVLNILYRDKHIQKPLPQSIADPYINIAGEYIDAAIRDWFNSNVGQDRLFYNKEFSILVGGPKWISEVDSETVCVRKYLGIKGEGDFTFIIYLPRWVLAFDDIIHSHSHPARWATMSDYSDHTKFAAIRNPIDIIHSSIFSINALTSEYIQRELNLDEHIIRRELALNKLSNPEFVTGLIDFLKNYFDEFITVQEKFDYLMRWEDLITNPAPEIQKIANVAGISVDTEYAKKIWAELDHRNLTRYHRHSFRRGLLNDWQFNITNTHLELFKDAGFDDYLNHFGYQPIKFFSEKDYTDDQKLIEKHIKAGQPYTENLDHDIITFAFNKTNFNPTANYTFKHHPRQGAIEIEKSTLHDDELASGFMKRMSAVTDNAYNYLDELESAVQLAAGGKKTPLKTLEEKYKVIFAQWLKDKSSSLFEQLHQKLAPKQPPCLVGSSGQHNIVHMEGKFYSIPQSLGPMDLANIDIGSIRENIFITGTFDEALQAITKISTK